MKRNLFIFLSIAVLALSFVLYKLLSFKSGFDSDPSGARMITYARDQHFHPDSALELNWVAYDKVFYFSRPNRLGAWKNNLSEVINPRQIQDRLVFLASSNYFPIDKIRDAIITARIKFDNHEVWELESNGRLLRWTTGPFSGKGGKLSPDAQNLFLTGRYSFQDLKMSWCSERPLEFIYENRKIVQSKSRWLKLIKKKQIEKELADQNFIEQWIGKNCYINTSRMYDEKLVKLDSPNKLQVKFQNSIKTLFWDSKALIKIHGDNSYYIKSNKMKISIEELTRKLQ